MHWMSRLGLCVENKHQVSVKKKPLPIDILDVSVNHEPKILEVSKLISKKQLDNMTLTEVVILELNYVTSS
jgi:hypothetical protein